MAALVPCHAVSYLEFQSPAGGREPPFCCKGKHLAELYGLFVCALMIGVLSWVSWRSLDTWPLTCYPMFSIVVDLATLRVGRIALVDHEGRSDWWRPEFNRMQRRVYRNLLKTGPLTKPAADEHAAAERTRLFAEVLRHLKPDQRRDVQTLRVIERRLELDNEGRAHVIDRVLCDVDAGTVER